MTGGPVGFVEKKKKKNGWILVSAYHHTLTNIGKGEKKMCTLVSTHTHSSKTLRYAVLTRHLFGWYRHLNLRLPPFSLAPCCPFFVCVRLPGPAHRGPNHPDPVLVDVSVLLLPQLALLQTHQRAAALLCSWPNLQRVGAHIHICTAPHTSAKKTKQKTHTHRF